MVTVTHQTNQGEKNDVDGNPRRYAWVESEPSPNFQQLREKFDPSLRKKNQINGDGGTNQPNDSKVFVKVSRDSTSSQHTQQHKKESINTSSFRTGHYQDQKSSSLRFGYNEIKDHDEKVERSLSQIKQKLAADVKDIEQTLKQCSDRRKSLMKTGNASFSHGAINSPTGKMDSENKKSSSVQRRKSLLDMHSKIKEQMFHRAHSAPSVFTSPPSSELKSQPSPERTSLAQVSNKIRLLNMGSKQFASFTSTPTSALLKGPHSSSPSGQATRNVANRKRKKRIGKTQIFNPPSSSPKKREEHRRVEAKKREQRAIKNKKRRDQLERERIEHIKQNSGDQRQERYREIAMQQKKKERLTQILLVGVAFSTRISKMINEIQYRRDLIKRHTLRNNAAGLITRKLRHYCFRCHRKRVRGAIRILGGVFVMKVRLWRDRRRNRAADVLREFLFALKDTGVFLGILTRGKRWRAYKDKVITVQQLWRTKQMILNAQVSLIDRQWQKEQEKRMNIEVEHIYNTEKEKTITDNKVIDSVNKARRAMKQKALPRKKISRKASIRRNLLNEGDLDILNIGQITPVEFRVGMIRETLQCLKKIFLKDMEKYRHDVESYDEEVKRRQRTGAFVRKSSSNKQVILTNSEEECKEPLTFLRSDEPISTVLTIPIKPRFHPALREQSLNLLMQLADKHIEKMRIAWDPYNMNTEIPDYQHVGKEVALCQYQEIGDYRTYMT